MFLVRDPRTNLLIFVHEDPRKDDYRGEVESGVSLEFPPEVLDWPDGAPRPQQVVGVREGDGKEYRVFRSDKDRRKAGYTKISDGTPLVARSWLDYSLRQIRGESLKELPEWVDVESGAIPAWDLLPPREKKQVAKRFQRLRRLPPERWNKAGAVRLKDTEPIYLLRITPEWVLFFRAEEGHERQFVIENFARQEMLDRYFSVPKESAEKL